MYVLQKQNLSLEVMISENTTCLQSSTDTEPSYRANVFKKQNLSRDKTLSRNRACFNWSQADSKNIQGGEYPDSA